VNKEELMKYSKEELVDLLLSYQEKSEIFDKISMMIDVFWFRKISVELVDKKEKEVSNGRLDRWTK
jgi:hypothetical protein